MANGLPSSETYAGLTRKVLQWTERFMHIVDMIKQKKLQPRDWAHLEELVDIPNFKRVGVLLKPEVEVSNWTHYKAFMIEYGGMVSWEGTLRRITEVPGLVIQELEERNTWNGVTDISNTVSIYKFNDAGKVTNLDIYVAHLGQRPAA
jgi:hypothetical protein